MAGPRAAVIFDADVPGFNAWAAPASRLPASTTSALTFVWSAAAGCYVVQLSELGRMLHGAPSDWDLHMTTGFSCSWRQSAAVTAALLHAALEPAARSGPPRCVFPFAAVAFLVAQPGTERAPLGALWRRRVASNAGVLVVAKAGLLGSSRERLTALPPPPPGGSSRARAPPAGSRTPWCSPARGTRWRSSPGGARRWRRAARAPQQQPRPGRWPSSRATSEDGRGTARGAASRRGGRALGLAAGVCTRSERPRL